MYGLTSILSTASEALNAETGAIAVTNNNIANVNTAGYSRQTVNLSAASLGGGGALQDDGVTFGGFSSVRDQVLQLAITQKTSDAGSLSAQSSAWSQIESAFSGTDAGLGAAVSTLFSSISALSTNPTDPAVRQTAYLSAGQLADAFHQAASSLTDAQTSADQSVSGTVTQINQLTSQIASLNGELAQMQASGQDGGSVQDQRDQLTVQLAQLAGVTVTNTGSTPSIALSNGTPLVIGHTAYSLQTTTGTSGTSQILDRQGNNITSQIRGGSIGGNLTMRDTEIPALQTSLNQFATNFASAMNTAQAQGYDPTGAQGQTMFSVPAGGVNAAANLSVALSSQAAIATSSDASAGSSGNVSNLLAVQTQPLASGQTPTSTYASFVQSLGSSSAEATATLNATNAALSQLTTQRDSESGVSVDEETTNLLRYQQAYSAAAKVVSTINQLFTVTMDMVSS